MWLVASPAELPRAPTPISTAAAPPDTLPASVFHTYWMSCAYVPFVYAEDDPLDRFEPEPVGLPVTVPMVLVLGYSRHPTVVAPQEKPTPCPSPPRSMFHRLSTSEA